MGKGKVWIVHGSVTYTEKPHVSWGVKSLNEHSKQFRTIAEAKAFAVKTAKEMGTRDVLYHDANETLHDLSHLLGKKRRKK